MTNKVALLTGATTGIGKETAKILASWGDSVVISGRREALGKKAADEIRAKGGEASFIFSDVNEEENIRQLIKMTTDKYGRLDMAVNNAGISNETVKIGDSDTEKFRKMLQTNVMGVYLCMKYEIQQMLNNEGGSIVNLASIAGLNGIPYAGPYGATKHAVVGLTKAGALDYATQNIRINAVAPGTTDTEIIAGSIAQGQYDYATVSAMQPMNRMGKPEEIAQGIAWLLSDNASFVPGHVLNIDGGFQAK
jgi:NAD(P)-dependent dehydrogenase (short-subunit alcohol dehydrogenase family)